MRTFIAIALCKLVKLILRVLGRGGTSLPGKIALRVYPELLRVLARDVTCVAVTGTNGKTTSARMLEQAIKDSGKTYFANRSGANLITGITTEFASNATLSGKPRKQYAVIECDEAAAVKVCEYIKPAVVLVTNVFRDQLDRFAEITATLENIKKALINSPDAKVVLGADCSMCSSLKDEIPNEVVFFGVETPIYKSGVSELSDAKHCVKCKTEYEYSYVTYAHLGGYSCPKCGYQRPPADVAVTRILERSDDGTSVEMRIFDETVTAYVNLPGGYNIYNATGAVAAACALGLGRETAVNAVGAFECGFGRMEKFDLGGRPARMILVKNPAGCNQTLNYLLDQEGELLFAVCLNDKIADGTDVSWVWDVDFESLCSMGGRLTNVLVSGIRADEMALRLKYAGLPEEKLHVIKDYRALLDAMLSQDKPVFIMPTYTAMLDLRAEICAKYGYKDFWE